MIRPAGGKVRLLAGAAALALVAGAAGRWPRSAAAEPIVPGVGRAPVAGVTLVCPAPDGGASSVLAATSTPGGGLALAAGGPALLAPGRQSGGAHTLPRRSGPVVVRGGGALAAGLVATLRTVAPSGAGRSLALDACVQPAADAWLVGPAADADGNPLLELANPDPAPAVAEVTVLTQDGPVTAADGPQVDLPADGAVQLSLPELVPEAAATAVHVVTTQGRVAAALLDRRQHTRYARGADWVPLAGAPAAQVVVGGIPAGVTAADLVIAAPGADALATVEVLAADRRYVPTGLERVPVAGGTVTVVPLGGAGQGPEALRVTAAGGPVLAAVRLDTGAVTAKAAGELAWLGPTAPLAGPAALPPGSQGMDRTLVLTALGRGGSVQLGDRRVDVPAGRTVGVDLRGGVTVAVPRRGGGQLLAVLVLHGPGSDRGGPLLTTYAPVGARLTAPAPPLVADPPAAYSSSSSSSS